MLTWETIVIRLVIALLAGGLLGAEREYRDKSAGLRTLSLICVGSCLFMLVSTLLSAGTTDRIASNIVTGIGFIGAGVIFKGQEGVNGITTAATIWATAAIGMAIGAGEYIAAGVATTMTLLVLAGFLWIEKIIDSVNTERVYTIVTSASSDTLQHYEQIMKNHHLYWKQEKKSKQGTEIRCIWRVQGSKKNQERFVETMLKDETIKVFEF